MERDAKRRRVKYKSVHTSKKSQTEIMREVIDNQMTLYRDWIKQKEEQERKTKEKLIKLSKEKVKAEQEQSSFQYSDNNLDYSNGNCPEWNNSFAYPSSYNTQYSGVITDWSHVYQGGIDYSLTSGINFLFKGLISII